MLPSNLKLNMIELKQNLIETSVTMTTLTMRASYFNRDGPFETWGGRWRQRAVRHTNAEIGNIDFYRDLVLHNNATVLLFYILL